MKFLIDTDVCSAHMRRPASLAHRFIQYPGAIAISAVSLGELYAGAHKHPNAPRLLNLIADLRQEVTVVDFDETCAEKFGRVRGTLLLRGMSVPTTDLMIGVSAFVVTVVVKPFSSTVTASNNVVICTRKRDSWRTRHSDSRSGMGREPGDPICLPLLAERPAAAAVRELHWR